VGSGEVFLKRFVVFRVDGAGHCFFADDLEPVIVE
jgi:hypothetical protein